MKYGRVAQLVEHLTFNQVVRGSNPRTLMNEEQRKLKHSKGFPLFFAVKYIMEIENIKRRSVWKW